MEKRSGNQEDATAERPQRSSEGRPRLAPVGYDYTSSRRGYWAKLRDGAGHEVVLTAFPGTLLAMLKAGVLVGLARADAESIKSLTSS